MSYRLELSGKNIVKILENGINNSINNLIGGNNIILTETPMRPRIRKSPFNPTIFRKRKRTSKKTSFTIRTNKPTIERR